MLSRLIHGISKACVHDVDISFSMRYNASRIKTANHDNSVGIVPRLRDGQPNNRGWIPGREKRVFSFPKSPDRLWYTPILLFNGYRGVFSRGVGWPFTLVPKLRMDGALHPVLYTPLWRALAICTFCHGNHAASFRNVVTFIGLPQRNDIVQRIATSWIQFNKGKYFRSCFLRAKRQWTLLNKADTVNLVASFIFVWCRSFLPWGYRF